MKYVQSKYIFGLVALILFVLQFAIPSPIFADDVSAGFAPHSVWLSKSDITSGDSVNIFAVLYNSSDNAITGELNFFVDGMSIGTKDFTVSSGETQIESFPWTATVGIHSLSATIGQISSSDSSVSTALQNETTGNISVVVAPVPAQTEATVPSQTSETINNITSTIENIISSSSPAVASGLSSIYNETESARTAIQSAAESEEAATAKSTTSNPIHNSTAS